MQTPIESDALQGGASAPCVTSEGEAGTATSRIGSARVGFTPGPWSLCCDKCMMVMGEDHPIAEVTSGEWGDRYAALRAINPGIGATYEPYIELIPYGAVKADFALANANLIAAAPALYEALELSVQYLMWCSADPNGGSTRLIAKRDLETVRAALKSARGE